VRPKGKADPDDSPKLSVVVAAQLSETAGEYVATALQTPESVPITMLAGQAIVGSWVSETTTEKEQEAESDAPSETEKETLLVPTEKDEALGRPAV